MCIFAEVFVNCYSQKYYCFRFEPGPSSSPVWIENIHCFYNNDSSSGYSCVHDGLGVTNCIHSQDVGISCLAGRHYVIRFEKMGQTHGGV